MSEQTVSENLGLDWPDAYAAIRPVLKDAWEIDGEIYLSRQLGGGKSGALVYSVDISCKGFTGQAILKLDESPDPRKQEQHEAELHAQAIKDAPKFAEKHLPRILHSAHHEDQIAVLSTIAARGLEYVEPWIECDYDRQMAAIHEVSSGLLTDWNADYRLSKNMRMPQDLVRHWLGRRIDPARGGRIHSLVTEECGLPADAPTLITEGDWFPNPLAFADGVGAIPKRLRMRGAMGHCHGDFHGLNLLLSEKDKPGADYFLIDLALYESDQYLFFDHAYFEVATLHISRGESSAEEWRTVVAHLGHFEGGDRYPGLRSDDIGLVAQMQAMRKGIKDWINSHEPDRLAFMESQMILARVAAGLNFSHKQIPLEARQMAFYYAAANLKDYLKLNRVKWPRTGPTFKITGVPVASSSGHERPSDPQPVGSQQQDEPVTVADTSGSLGSFFHELRRRNVVRVAGLYAVLAWLCIQVATVLQTPLRLPDWSTALVALLLAIGFPIVCVISWVFEMGNSGLQRTRPSNAPPKRDHTKAIVDFGIMAGIVLIIGLSAREVLPSLRDLTSLGTSSTTVSRSEQADGLTSLAVLPFTNLDSGTDDSFADGLTIEIINVLVQTGVFRIPGATSSFQYKAQPGDLREIGKALNVDYLVEGSVRQSGENLRIKASLVRADDGFLIWSENYSETMRNVFVAQEKIAESIGRALSTPLSIDAKVLQAQRSDDPEAYTKFVRGMALLEQRGPALKGAKETLERAVQIHSDFPAAWGALSLVYNYIPSYFKTLDGEPVKAAEFYRKAKDAAEKAHDIDPDLPIVQHALGNMYQRSRQWENAEAAYDAALLADPTNHRVMQDYAALLQTVGKEADALAKITRAKEVDPLNELYHLWEAFFLWQNDQTEARIGVIEDIFRRSPRFRELAIRMIIDHRAMKGELNRVRDFLDACDDCSGTLRRQVFRMLDAGENQPAAEVFQQYKSENILGYQFLYAIGKDDVVLQAFNYYGLTAERRLQYFTTPWSLVDEIGQNPGFVKTAQDMKLVAYWRNKGWPDLCRPTTGEDFVCNRP